MRAHWTWPLWTLLLSFGAAAEPSDPLVLSFIATTDVHGHIEATKETLILDEEKVEVERGGAALLGGYLASLRKRHPVILVDAGDMLQGTLLSNLEEGAATVRAMNALGYAAAAIGNHEFDFGPVDKNGQARSVSQEPGDDPLGNLKARAAQAKFPWLTANVVEAKTGKVVASPLVRAFTIIELQGVKVGIIGGTSEDTPRTTIKPNLVGLNVLPLVPSLARAAAEARAAGATVIVLVVHAGGECSRFDRPDDSSGCLQDTELFELARRLPRGTVDAIFGGHTHQGVAAVVAGVPIAQAFSYGVAFSRIDLAIDRKSGCVIPGGAKVYPPTEICGRVADGVPSCDPRRARGKRAVDAVYEGMKVTSDAAVVASLASDLVKISALRARPIGITLEAPLQRGHRAESPLGNLVADLLRSAVAKADVGMTNGGGLRADLPAGELTYGALFEAFPFENRVASVRMKGALLRELITSNVAGTKGILSLSGVRVVARCEDRKLRVTISLGGRRPLDDRAIYTVATTDFLALGGDDFGTFVARLPKGAVKIDDAAPTLRDLIAERLGRQGTRLTAGPRLFDRRHPRIVLPEPRPFRCD